MIYECEECNQSVAVTFTCSKCGKEICSDCVYMTSELCGECEVGFE